MSDLTVIAVGRSHELSEIALVRDPRQLAAVAEIVADPTFDFACNNPFTAEVGKYVGPFSFTWYTVDGAMHVRRIGKSGRTLADWTR